MSREDRDYCIDRCREAISGLPTIEKIVAVAPHDMFASVIVLDKEHHYKVYTVDYWTWKISH